MFKIFLFTFLIEITSTMEHQFSWNSSNPIFRAQKRPEIEVRIGDVVRFVCPTSDVAEYLTIYEVGELAFDDCVTETTSRQILRCSPETLAEQMLRSPQLMGAAGQDGGTMAAKNVAQIIRQLTPVPTGKEFQPGQTYYYITTSTGKPEGIDKTSRGLCETSNMRLTMKVLPPTAPTPPSSPPATRQRQELRRQQHYNSADGDEDEDSLNDEAINYRQRHPKFRRPTQFREAAAEAGVHDQQFLKVAQMAKEGKTGTFENSKEYSTTSFEAQGAWDPINVEFVSSIMQKTYNNANNDLTSYQRDEPDFVIHEDNNVRSLEYSSDAISTSSSNLFFALSLMLLIFV